MKKKRLHNYFCHNESCRAYGIKGSDNIVKNGHRRNGLQNFKCTDCRMHEVTVFLIKDVKLGTHEIDEFWSFVKKNKKKLPRNFSQTLSKAMRTLT